MTFDQRSSYKNCHEEGHKLNFKEDGGRRAVEYNAWNSSVSLQCWLEFMSEGLKIKVRWRMNI